MRKLLLLILSLCLVQTSMSAETLNPASMKDWSLVVDENAIASERYAAEEFQGLFKEAIGIELPICNTPPQSTHNIFIGAGQAMSQSPVAFSIDDLGEEGLRIYIQSGNIAIAGGRPRGTLYGVYEFAEKYLGVRFLTWDHTYFPKTAAKTIPCEEYEYIPPFSFRWSYYKENADKPEFAARNRVNTTTDQEKLGWKTHQNLINHSFYRLLPVKEYGEAHPEYYAFIDGKRALEMGGGGPELCVTNPEVIELVAQNTIKALDADPTQANFSVSQNDNDAYCRCENCEAVNQREGTPMGSNLALVNAVAERVEKKYPDVKIGTLAYWYTRKAPKTIRPRDNVQIQLCSIECCTLHSIDDPNCSRNREFCSDMAEWGKICKDIWVWNYNTNFHHYDLPFPNLRSIGPNVRYFLKNNVKGLFMQANGNGNSGEMCDLRNYVISHCIWNPQLDSWELAKEFCRLHYQGAAQPVIDYLTMLHDNAEQLGCHPGCFPTPADVGLNPEISGKSLAYFKKALQMADNDLVRQRVEKASICAYKAVLETCATVTLENGDYRISLPEQYKDVFDRYVELTKKYNMTRSKEQEPVSEYIDRVAQAINKEIPALQLENEIWKLTVVPSDNGKIVEMIHKPTSQNVLVPREFGSIGEVFPVGTVREFGMIGYDQDNPLAFEGSKTGDSISMLKKLPDGSQMMRRIWLDASQPEKIFFKTTVEHKTDESKIYQIKVIPHFYTMTTSDDDKILTAYVKKDTWLTFNKDWMENGSLPPDEALERETSGFAFFNHETGSGMMASYNPNEVARPRLWWQPRSEQVNLELLTSPINLGQGESFSFGYQFEYLDKPPE